MANGGGVRGSAPAPCVPTAQSRGACYGRRTLRLVKNPNPVLASCRRICLARDDWVKTSLFALLFCHRLVGSF